LIRSFQKKRRSQKNKIMSQEICHDCKKVLSLKDSVAKYEKAGEIFYKCQECFRKDSTLRNFQKCEVYSRIVGYIRPVGQWNAGKTEEYKDRKEFAIENC